MGKQSIDELAEVLILAIRNEVKHKCGILYDGLESINDQGVLTPSDVAELFLQFFD